MNTKLKAKSFLENNRLATLATLSEHASAPQASAVYYTYENGHLYFATEKDSRKSQNILKHKKVALVIVQESQLEMIQLEGEAELVKDSEEKLRLITQIYDRLKKEDTFEPWPILKLHPEHLEVFKVEIDWFKYSNFIEEPEVLQGSLNDLN